MLVAVLLAYEKANAELLSYAPLRALIPFKGQPIISFPLSEVRKICETVFVLTNESHSFWNELVSAGVSVNFISEFSVSNIRPLFSSFSSNDQILFLGGDLYALSKSEIEDFCNFAGVHDGISVPLVPRELIPQRLDKKFIKLQDGEFCVGRGLVAKCGELVKHNFLDKIEFFINSPLLGISKLGLTFSLKFFSGKLRLKDVQQAFFEYFRVNISFFICSNLGWSLNLATLSDYEYSTDFLSTLI